MRSEGRDVRNSRDPTFPVATCRWMCEIFDRVVKGKSGAGIVRLDR